MEIALIRGSFGLRIMRNIKKANIINLLRLIKTMITTIHLVE